MLLVKPPCLKATSHLSSFMDSASGAEVVPCKALRMASAAVGSCQVIDLKNDQQMGFFKPQIDQVGGWPTPLENQLGWFFPIYGKIKNVPNHQPEIEKKQKRCNLPSCHQTWQWIFHDFPYFVWYFMMFPLKLPFWELSLTAATFEYQRVSWDFTDLCCWGLPIKLL